MSYFFIAYTSVSFKGEADVWFDSPTQTGIILYSVVTPILCCCGLIGNTISLIVLKRKELVGSVYTYLAVLAAVDLGTSIILLMGGISRGIMWKHGWVLYDSLIGLPMSGTLNTLGVFAIIGLTIDRVIYLLNPVQCTHPKFCNAWVARRVMIVSVMVAVVLNLPYCFIYKWDDNSNLTTTEFFDCIVYKVFNWITLFVVAIIPAVILVFGNGFLIMSLRKAKIINKKSMKCRTKRCKRRDHTSLTVTLVMIIVFFLITNIPENLVSRTAAINLLFQGDHDRANTGTLENLRQICTIVGAIDVNTNFVFYYTFCPAFCKALKTVFSCKKRRPSSTLQVNVYVLNANGTKANQLANVEDKCLNKTMQEVLEKSRKSIGSAFTINLGDNDKERKNERLLQNRDYIIATPSEYVEIGNEYAPPFSTVFEESSGYTADSNLSQKNIV